MTLIVPPFQVPDEIAHWKTAMYRSSFAAEKCQPGMGLPDQFDYEKVWRGSPIGFRKIQTTYGCLDAEFYYGNFLTYPGIWLTRWWANAGSESRVWMILFYLTRLFQGICVGAALLYLYKSVQVPGVATLTVLCLSPLFLQQSFGVTADGVVLSYSILLIAWLLNNRPFRLAKKRDYWLEWITLGFGFIASTTKAPILLAGLFVLGLAWMRGNPMRNSKWIHKNSLLFSMIAVWIGVTAYCSHVSFGKALAFDQFVPGFKRVLQFGPVDPSAQIEYLKHHISLWPSIFLAPLGEFFHLQSYTGHMAWWTMTSSKLTIRLWQFLVAAVLLLELRRVRPSRVNGKVALLTVLFGLIVLVSAVAQELAVYLTYTPVGYPQPLGLQARYFYPLLLLTFAYLFWLLHRGRTPAGNTKAANIPVAETRAGQIGLWFLILLYLPLWMISIFVDFAFTYH